MYKCGYPTKQYLTTVCPTPSVSLRCGVPPCPLGASACLVCCYGSVAQSITTFGTIWDVVVVCDV